MDFCPPMSQMLSVYLGDGRAFLDASCKRGRVRTATASDFVLGRGRTHGTRGFQCGSRRWARSGSRPPAGAASPRSSCRHCPGLCAPKPRAVIGSGKGDRGSRCDSPYATLPVQHEQPHLALPGAVLLNDGVEPHGRDRPSASVRRPAQLADAPTLAPAGHANQRPIFHVLGTHAFVASASFTGFPPCAALRPSCRPSNLHLQPSAGPHWPLG